MGVYQFDTQSWNSIEKIEGTLQRFPDPRGVPFLLRVTMVSNGTSRYPVVSLEAQMSPTETPPEHDKAYVDLCVKAGYLLDGDGNLADGKTLDEARLMLSLLITHKYPGWMQDARLKKVIVDRVEVVGVVPAMAKMVTEGLSA